MSSLAEDALLALLNLDAEIRVYRSILAAADDGGGRLPTTWSDDISMLREQLRAAELRREEQFLALHRLSRSH
ncbi:hypothetical protein [Paraburkholderia tropica]|uniref:hypothetical protein n=1 Tax=Paraburkholderia tropica TaxID=92647 RepID=UPI003D26AF2C